MVENREQSASGFLADSELRAAITNKELVSSGFDERQLHGSSYEFRVSDIAYSYDYEAKTTKQHKKSFHIIRPFETLTMITLETVNLDERHLLFLFAKGSLFSLGLTPVSTVADPGFKGRLGITLTNLSARPVRFDVGQAFVKGFFARLESPVKLQYTGQHGAAEISWPFPNQFHTDPVDFEEWDADHWKFLPSPVRRTMSRLHSIEGYLNKLMLVFIGLIFLNLLIWVLQSTLPAQTWISARSVLDVVAIFASIGGFWLSLRAYQTR